MKIRIDWIKHVVLNIALCLFMLWITSQLLTPTNDTFVNCYDGNNHIILNQTCFVEGYTPDENIEIILIIAFILIFLNGFSFSKGSKEKKRKEKKVKKYKNQKRQ